MVDFQIQIATEISGQIRTFSIYFEPLAKVAYGPIDQIASLLKI